MLYSGEISPTKCNNCIVLPMMGEIVTRNM